MFGAPDRYRICTRLHTSHDAVRIPVPHRTRGATHSPGALSCRPCATVRALETLWSSTSMPQHAAAANITVITMVNAKFRGTLLNWMHHMHRMPNAPRAVIHALGDGGMHNCSQFVDHHPRAATCAALRACQVLYTGRRQRQAFRLACEGAHGTDCFV